MNKTIEDKKFEAWKHGLLDIGKRNKMINYRKSKRQTLEITAPDLPSLYNRIAVNEESISFKRRVDTSRDIRLTEFFYFMDRASAPIELATGEIASDLSTVDMNRTLKQIRSRAKISQEEQGINTLYLSFGFLEWKQKAGDKPMLAPLILVPVTIELSSLTSPYTIRRIEEDVVINPTLEYVLSSEYGIRLPEFNYANDDILEYLDIVDQEVQKMGWRIVYEVNLGLLSFLKIVMYNDLEKYRDQIFKNPVIQAFCGDPSALPGMDETWHNYVHDQDAYSETFQVVNADASQQDAIMLSKKGVSFVLQGPPGTGKSQTITNIIAEALAAGKKVLFVSEKMAALSVVYRRLEEVNLSDYCLSLHNYKAEKKGVIQNLIDTLDAPIKRVKAGAADFITTLEKDRTDLNQYFSELTKVRMPLNMSIYDIITDLAMLESVPTYVISSDVQEVTEQEYKQRLALLKKLREFLMQYQGKIGENPWRGTNISMLTYDKQNEIDTTLSQLEPAVFNAASVTTMLGTDYAFKHEWTYGDFQKLCSNLHAILLIQQVKDQIDSFYNSQFTSQLGLSEAIRLQNDYSSIAAQSIECGFAANSLELSEERQVIGNECRSRLDRIQNLLHIITDFEKRFGIRTERTKSGLDYIREFLKRGLLIEQSENSWVTENGRSAARQYCKSASNKIQSMDELWHELLQCQADVSGDPIARTANKEIQEYLDYYNKSDVRVKLFLVELEEIKTDSARVGLSDSDIRSINGIESQLHSRESKIRILREMIEFIDNINVVTGLSLDYNSRSVRQAVDYIRVLSAAYNYPVELIMEQKIRTVSNIAAGRKEQAYKIREIKEQIDSEWAADFYKLNASELLGRFRTDYTSFFKTFSSAYKQDKRTLAALKKNLTGKLDDQQCIRGLEQLQEYQSLLESFQSSEQEAVILGNHYNGLQTDWATLAQFIDACASCENYTQIYGVNEKVLDLISKPYLQRRLILLGNRTITEWVDSGKLDEMVQCVQGIDSPDHLRTLSDLKADVDVLQRMLARTRKMCNFLCKDYEYITGQNTAENVQKDVTVDQLQECLLKYHSLCSCIQEYKEYYEAGKNILPRLFKGDNTDWEYIQRLIDSTESFYELIKGEADITAVSKWLYMDVPDRESFELAGVRTEEIISDQFFDRIETAVREFGEDFSETEDQLIRKIEVVLAYDAHRDRLSSLLVNCSNDSPISELHKIIDKYVKIYGYINDEQQPFLNYFEGIHVPITDPAVRQNVETLMSDYINLELIRTNAEKLWSVFENAWALFRQELLQAVTLCRNETPDRTALNQFTNWFSDERFDSIPLDQLDERVTECRQLSHLNNWLSYRDIVDNCRAEGLAEYLDYIESTQSVRDRLIVSVYKKAFLTKWLMDRLVNENITSLMKFQAFAHEATISDFKVNSNRQLKVAQARILEKLSQEKPSGTYQMMNAMDEISILRKEAEKRRNIMPLRKLFKVIPTLLQKLKPCFMMSPLSVSYFLDSEMYRFDLVVFDEASQILPEDAVGAIYRGNQVIIAGDTKQMPPTTFFSASAKSEEFDIDEDQEEDEDFYIPDIVSESILDEANTCLPTCTLLWHYRSKDESLIAFSNKEIYGNKLITFPNCSRGTDRGLEYIYVPNGCYHERGNLMEAKRCVQLVAEHIENHPDRSLGIIAFSEKQQGIIEDAVNEFRLSCPEYEDFFSDEKEEPFFVKNLENVQGDERDTIIFSICYGKNNKGQMYMRFGPLGKAGGERRLNVAITRAKYNVKLVGSILPTDIDPKRVSAEGALLLRDYIYYAMQNDYGMPLGSDTAATDEAFIDLVADFLYENGYKIRRNVGESDYKVDIAVIHPDTEDEYFAGIECDGHNYTMARTAHDRDILRKDIMMSMGWEIHHVWSFNWYKNPKQEKERLLLFLEKAQEKFTKKLNGVSPESTENSHVAAGEVALEDMIVDSDSSTEVHKISFAHYLTCDPYRASYEYGSSNEERIDQYIMYVMEQEAPIHIELLCKRLAPVFGRQKATVAVSRTIGWRLKAGLSDRIRIKEDFLYLTGQNEIKARVPGTEDDIRPIEYICPEEIEDAIVSIIGFVYGLTLDDLIGEVARAFGYARTGQKIREIVYQCYSHLKRTRKLKEVDGKIYLKES